MTEPIKRRTSVDEFTGLDIDDRLRDAARDKERRMGAPGIYRPGAEEATSGADDPEGFLSTREKEIIGEICAEIGVPTPTIVTDNPRRTTPEVMQDDNYEEAINKAPPSALSALSKKVFGK